MVELMDLSNELLEQVLIPTPPPPPPPPPYLSPLLPSPPSSPLLPSPPSRCSSSQTGRLCSPSAPPAPGWQSSSPGPRSGGRLSARRRWKHKMKIKKLLARALGTMKTNWRPRPNFLWTTCWNLWVVWRPAPPSSSVSCTSTSSGGSLDTATRTRRRTRYGFAIVRRLRIQTKKLWKAIMGFESQPSASQPSS